MMSNEGRRGPVTPMAGRFTRRALLRTSALTGAGAFALGAVPALRQTAWAQQQQIQPAFSNHLLASLDLANLEIMQENGDFMPPGPVTSDRYLVSLSSEQGFNAYLDLVQPPAGLSSAQAQEQLLSAARDDTPAPGWTYGGGTYAIDGGTAWVVLDLTPGNWAWGLTSQPAAAGATETAHVIPLLVTAAMPAAGTIGVARTAIQPTVDVALAEMAFQVLGGTSIATGPAIWRVRNVGQQPHHMVLYRTPRLITPDDIMQLLSAFRSATPTPPPSWWMEAVWVGYTAILSPGHQVFTEFSLSPGAYLALCFIVDPRTHLPHLAEGMAQSFTVAQSGTPPSATPVMATPAG